MEKPYSLINPLNYADYKELVVNYSETGKCTGEQLAERIEATKINAQRIKRIDKTYVPSDKIVKQIQTISSPVMWVMIVESWCGDAAQNIPIIAKLASLNPHIELMIILRDENPDIMDLHLTNGSRSIPKLIILDPVFKNLLKEWGPRPAAIQKMVKEYKLANPEVTHDEFVKNLHLWYARDKGLSLEQDLLSLLES